jgi:hypothetical protein
MSAETAFTPPHPSPCHDPCLSLSLSLSPLSVYSILWYGGPEYFIYKVETRIKDEESSCLWGAWVGLGCSLLVGDGDRWNIKNKRILTLQLN